MCVGVVVVVGAGKSSKEKISKCREGELEKIKFAKDSPESHCSLGSL